MAPKEVTLTTGRTLTQGVGSEKGKSSETYSKETSKIQMDPEDMKEMDLHLKDPVKIKTEQGEVVLRADKSNDAPHKGIVFLPYGPFANKLIGTNTDSTGMPDFKNITAKLEQTDEKPTGLEELTEQPIEEEE